MLTDLKSQEKCINSMPQRSKSQIHDAHIYIYLSTQQRGLSVVIHAAAAEIKWTVSDSVVLCCVMCRLMTYLLRVRARVSVAALILFCASTWVISSAFVSLMDTTQSPTPTPAWAALPPGVSWTEENTGTETDER